MPRARPLPGLAPPAKRATLGLALLALTACRPPAGDDAADDPADDTAPDSGDTGGDTADTAATPTVPTWTEAEAQAAFVEATAGGLPSPKTVRDVYFAALAEGADDTCPGSEQLDGADPLGCTSQQGWFFAGFSSWLEQDLGDGTEWMLSGDFVIREPEGEAFEVGGHAIHRFQETTQWTAWRSEFSGSWRYEGHDGWLGEGTSSLLRVEGTHDGTGDRLRLDGGITQHGLSLFFAGLERVPNGCGGGWQGVASVRDPVGAWWELTLSGDCEGCGALTFAGEARGEGCFALNPLAEALEAELGVP